MRPCRGRLMAPPRRDIPWVKRSIGFLPSDVEMLEAVRTRLNEPDGSAAIRRLIRDAFDGAQATHLPAKPVKPVSEPEKRPSVKVGEAVQFGNDPPIMVTRANRNSFKPHPKPKKGKK